MAVSPRKTSKERKRLRRTNIKLHMPGLTPCPNCGALRKPHFVCPNCGYYDGKEIINKK